MAPTPNILFVKTSSLGDVIHHMPALADARRHFPNAHIGWVVEEQFVPLVRMHPAVDEVIAVASRRWRHTKFTWTTAWDLWAFWRAIRARRYDAIIDTQGLWRTGYFSRHARGRVHGYDRASVREPLACRFYNVLHSVPRDLHAITRNRMLTGLALGYQPDGVIDYGLARERLGGAGGYGIVFHSTTQSEKEWPRDRWRALCLKLSARGLPLVLPWGTPSERERAMAIAAAVPNASVPERQALDAMARLVAGASFVVGVDTGLVHLAAALEVPLIAIFMSSKPGLTGPMGRGKISIVGGNQRIPDVDEVFAAIERIL